MSNQGYEGSKYSKEELSFMANEILRFSSEHTHREEILKFAAEFQKRTGVPTWAFPDFVLYYANLME